MSRAFTREIDDAPAPPPPERPVSGALNLVTPRGARLIDEAIAAIDAALAGTPVDETIATLRRDQRYWAARRTTMQVVEPSEDPTAVGFGTVVRIRRNGSTRDIRIVGEDEADPAADLIAWTAPLAKALDGAEPGEEVEFAAGGRTETITVVTVTRAADSL